MIFDAAKARRAQTKLAAKVRFEEGVSDARLVAGLDVAYKAGYSFGAAVLVDRRSMLVVDGKVSRLETKVPYIPGLLAFREAGPMISALLKLAYPPDAILVNGHGLAHPRRFGIACHLGVALDVRSVGVARKRLVGAERGDRLYFGGEEVARIIRNGRLKLYVSVGHKATLEESVRLVKGLLYKPNKLPLPLQEAHNLATKAARSA